MSNNNSFSIYDYRKINFSKFEYSIPKTIQGGNKASFLYYRESHNKVNTLYIRIPKLKTTSGICKKGTSFYIEVELNLNSDHSEFFDFLNKVDKHNCLITFQNSVDWFNNQIPQDTIDEYYRPSIKLNSGGKNPSLRLKIPMKGNSIIPQIYNNNTIIDYSYVSPDDNVECIISLSEVRFSSEKFYPIWNLIQLKINKKINSDVIYPLTNLLNYNNTDTETEIDNTQHNNININNKRLAEEELERTRREQEELERKRREQEELERKQREQIESENYERIMKEYYMNEENNGEDEGKEDEDEDEYNIYDFEEDEDEFRLRLEEEDAEKKRIEMFEIAERNIDLEEYSVLLDKMVDDSKKQSFDEKKQIEEDYSLKQKKNKLDRDRLEKDKLEQELEEKRLENERIKQMLEKENLEKEKLKLKKMEQDGINSEKLERARLKQRIEEERLEEKRLRQLIEEEILEKEKLRQLVEEEERRLEEERIIEEARILEEERIKKEQQRLHEIELEKERVKQEKIKKLKEMKLEAQKLKQEIQYNSDEEDEEENINKEKYYTIDPEYKKNLVLDDLEELKI
jgi:hypothetical protein